MTGVLTAGARGPRTDSDNRGGRRGGRSPGCELCSRSPAGRWHRGLPTPRRLARGPQNSAGSSFEAPSVCVWGGGVAARGQLGGSGGNVRTGHLVLGSSVGGGPRFPASLGQTTGVPGSGPRGSLSLLPSPDTQAPQTQPGVQKPVPTTDGHMDLSSGCGSRAERNPRGCDRCQASPK